MYAAVVVEVISMMMLLTLLMRTLATTFHSYNTSVWNIFEVDDEEIFGLFSSTGFSTLRDLRT